MDGETEATVAFKERWREGGREREREGWMDGKDGAKRVEMDKFRPGH